MADKCDATLKEIIKEHGAGWALSGATVYDSQGNSCHVSKESLGVLSTQGMMDPQKKLECGQSIGGTKSSGPGKYALKPLREGKCGGGNGGSGGGSSGGSGGPGGAG